MTESSDSSGTLGPRKRGRRVVKKSPAGDYDRSMDAPGTQVASSSDEVRTVELDDESSSDTLLGEEFYRNERPPHHGG